jgi:hypothetical protein
MCHGGHNGLSGIPHVNHAYFERNLTPVTALEADIHA